MQRSLHKQQALRLKEGEETFTKELLQISDKYELIFLKEKCEEALIKVWTLALFSVFSLPDF